MTASDYLEFSRSFFKDSLNIEVVEIDKENAIHTTKEFDVETFIFQIDAVPAVDRLIKSALSYLKKDGVLFIAAINESVLRRCAKMFMGAWKRLNNSKINVDEGNPSYRAGPRTHVSFAILQKKLIAAHHMDIESRRIQLDRGKYMDVMVIRPKLVR